MRLFKSFVKALMLMVAIFAFAFLVDFILTVSATDPVTAFAALIAVLGFLFFWFSFYMFENKK